MPTDILVPHLNIKLLKEQRNHLVQVRNHTFAPVMTQAQKNAIDGTVNLLDSMLDIAENQMTPSLSKLYEEAAKKFTRDNATVWDISYNVHATDSEEDPTGRSQHEPGAKLDNGKARPWLVFWGFANALSAVVDVGTFGANKYTDNGWKEVPNGTNRYLDAAMRHMLAGMQGEPDDPESGYPHLAHAIWNLLAVLELRYQSENRND